MRGWPVYIGAIVSGSLLGWMVTSIWPGLMRDHAEAVGTVYLTLGGVLLFCALIWLWRIWRGTWR